MAIRFMAHAALLALCAGAAAPALGQDYRSSGFERPRGADAMLQLRLPLGSPARDTRPSVALTVGFGSAGVYGSGGPAALGRMPVVELRFGRTGLDRARLAGIDLADPDEDRRLNADGHSGGNRTLRLVLIGLVGAAVGAGVEELLDNGDGDPSPDSSDYTPPPVG